MVVICTCRIGVGHENHSVTKAPSSIHEPRSSSFLTAYLLMVWIDACFEPETVTFSFI